MRRFARAAVFLIGVTGAAAAQEPSPVVPPDPRSVLGAPRGRALSGPQLDAEADRVSALLRCPVCQGLSVADSPNGMAVNMRRQVRELVAAGYDEDQILSYFEESYGEFVRLKPPLRGVNWLVWAGPLAGLLVGVVVVRRVLGSRAIEATPAAAGSAVDDPLPGRDTLPADPSLTRCVLEVRERAYGWRGGVAPVAPPLAIPTTSSDKPVR
jgi:cytochrome c-type biogenesis protein CcmH